MKLTNGWEFEGLLVQLVYQTNFNQPTLSAGPRIVQLAAKVSF